MHILLRRIDVLANDWLLWWSPHYQAGQTVSQHSAVARGAGRIAGCVFCRLLGAFHKNHCDWSLKP